MPKLLVVSARKLIKVLKKAGYVHDRTEGSHYIFCPSQAGLVLTDMSPENKSVARKDQFSVEELPPGIVRVEGASVGFFWRNLFSGNFDREAEEAWYRAEEKALAVLEQDLAEKGLLGEHELLAPANVQRGMWANLRGEAELKGFLIFLKGGAKLSGESKTVSSVQFAWQPNEMDVLITEIPVDKLVFRQDPSVSRPRISFTFNPEAFFRRQLASVPLGWSAAIYEVQVRRFPHPNDYLKESFLKRATYLSSSQKELEALPLPARIS